MYLVDTNVISAAAPSRRAAPPALVEWMDRRSANLFLSAVSVAEIEAGITRARREGAVAKARDLAAWLDALLHFYSDRVLTFDADVARVAGRLSDRARAQGRPPGFADIIIAATAAHHRLILLTRNVKHFQPLGVAFENPFETLPDEFPDRTI